MITSLYLVLKVFWFSIHSSYSLKEYSMFLFSCCFSLTFIQVVEADPVSSSRGGHGTRSKSIGLIHSFGLSVCFIGGNVTEIGY